MDVQAYDDGANFIILKKKWCSEIKDTDDLLDVSR